jgi:DNA repair exonuclease SbcCD ATPase subunit
MMARYAVILAALVGSAAAANVSPIQKTVQLIDDLAAKVKAEGEASQKIFEEFTEWCEDRSKDLGFEIKTGKSEIESLQASIAESVSTASSLTTKIEELAGAIAKSEADLKDATGIREEESADFKAEEKELMEIIDMLQRAINILEREMAKGGASMLQGKNLGSLSSALTVMVQASLIGTSDAAKLTAFIQGGSDDSEEELSAPEAAAYESKSGGIVDTLESLLDKASAQLDAARKKETEALHNFELLKQSLTDEIKFSNEEMAEAKKSLAAASEAKSTAEGDLTVTSKELSVDIADKEKLDQDCMTKADDFAAEKKSRAEELKALAEASKILSEMTGDAAEVSYSAASLLQTGSSSGLSSSADLANFEVARFVRDLARKQQEPVLAQLAQRIAAAVRSGARTGADPFEKVKGLISDMIAKLEKSAEEDATKKAYCDKEMTETEAKKEYKSDAIDKLSTKIDKMTAASAKLKEEVVKLQNELSKLAAAQAEMDQIRSKENAEYKENKAALESGIEGVKKATQVLKEYYAKGDKAHASADGAGSSIIGLLEVCESDFSKDLAGIVAAEEAAVNDYESTSQANSIDKTTKEADVKYKTKEATSLDKAVSEASSDRASTQTELDAVLEYYEKLKEQCIAKVESYAVKAERRAAEIEGLKQALSILENEAALVQQSSRRLRGIRAH